MIRDLHTLAALGILAATCAALWIVSPLLHDAIGWIAAGYPGNIASAEAAE